MQLQLISQTATTLTLGWTSVPNCSGYRFSSEKAKASWTWDPTRSSVRFAKGSAWYRVEALAVRDSGTYPPPASGGLVPPQVPGDTQTPH